MKRLLMVSAWFWGNSALPHLNYHNYLGVKFTYNGTWDAHIKDLVTAGRHKVNSLENFE